MAKYPKESGIYAIYHPETEECWYIGQAKNLNSRLVYHPVVRFLESKGLEYVVNWLPTEEDELDEVERTYIRRLLPVLNTLHNEGCDNELRREYTAFIAKPDKEPEIERPRRLLKIAHLHLGAVGWSTYARTNDLSAFFDLMEHNDKRIAELEAEVQELIRVINSLRMQAPG